MTALFGPQGSNAVTELPTNTTSQRYGSNQTWVKDASGPGANDGTVLDAPFYNRIIGALEYLVGVSGITASPGDMTVLYRSVLAIISKDAPAALDTLRELADAIGQNPNFAGTISTSLANRLRFDGPQLLTLVQQEQARENLRLALVAGTGNYSDLSGRPTLGTAASKNVGTAAFQVVQLDATAKLPAVDGSQLTNVTVTWENVSGKPTFATVATSGAYADLTGAPALATVATSGAYADLTGLPTLFSGAYADLTGLPTLFSGAYADLTGLPTLFSGAYADLTGLPTLFSGAYADLSGKPTLGTAAALDVGTTANKVVQLDGTGKLPAIDGSQLTNLPAGGAPAWADITGKPSFAAIATTAAYADLSGAPTLGTAAALDVGTTANKVVQLDGTAKLPAVDGSQLTNLPSSSFPSGTLMLFQQTAAPTGWTKQTTHNDKALRVVSGTASSGGTNSFSSVMAQTTVGNTTLTTTTMPSHTHSELYPAGSVGAGPDGTYGWANSSYAATNTGSAGSNGAHNHTISMSIQYVDLIIASKN